VGVEIMDGAEPVQAHPFTGPTAFMIGNEVRRCLPLSIRFVNSHVAGMAWKAWRASGACLHGST